MSEKLTCPGCNAHLSSVLIAYQSGRPCPNCGLSAAAMDEVFQARERITNKEFLEKYQNVVLENDSLKHKLSSALDRLREVKEAMDGFNE